MRTLTAMPASVFEKRSPLPVDRDTAFAWHDRPGAFERLTPPFEPVTLVEQTGGIRDGAKVVIKINNGPIAIRWHARHEGYDPPAKFEDVQTKGPFARWHHRHLFEEAADGTSVMHDHVTYAPPFGPLGKLGMPIIRKKLDRMFAYRHDTLINDLTDHARFAEEGTKTFVVTGASGLLGTQLCAYLSTGGHRVRRMVRDRAQAGGDRFFWDPIGGAFDPEALDGADFVIHLAGEQVFALRWSEAKKKRLTESRRLGTQTVARAIALHGGVRTLVSASAVGYYGHQPGGTLDESAGKGEGFLSDVCAAWEAGTEEARDAGVRVAITRIGVVLTPAGGALKAMLPAFKLGLGGRLGPGTQAFPWISIDDTIRALHWCARRKDIEGPVNLVAPERLDQRTYAKTLARTLRRPSFMTTPAWALRLAMGELADEIALKDAPVVPGVLERTGFAFRDDRASAALARLLGRPQR